jgi:hypothetical protein
VNIQVIEKKYSENAEAGVVLVVMVVNFLYFCGSSTIKI